MWKKYALLIFSLLALVALSWGAVEATTFVDQHKIVGTTEYQELTEEFADLKQENNMLKTEYRNLTEALLLMEQELEKTNLQLKEAQADIARTNEEIERYKSRLRSFGETADKTAYLTFDDGPSNTTPKILEMLDQHGVQATFFVVGNNSEFGKKMYQEILARGHAIGNHTFSHDYQLYYDLDGFLEDFFKLEELVHEVTGVRPTAYRFPGGSNSNYGNQEVRNEAMKILAAKGYAHYDWHISSGDASSTRPSAEQIYQNVIGRLSRDHAVILFHDSHNNWPQL